MASTTYEHPGDVTEMYAAQEQFRHATKMVCDFVKANKMVTFCHQFAVLGNNIVRNAGQLPQPFWLGAACGGGSCNFPASAARA